MLNRKKAPAIKDAVNMSLHLPPYIAFTLSNGVPVYTVQAGSQEVLQVELLFFAGLWYEQQELLSATTNFLLKNGTKTKTAFQLNEQVEYYGAYLSRGCFNDVSNITLHCLNKHLPHLLPVVSEILTESIFPDDELVIYKNNQLQRLDINLKKCEFVGNRLIDEYVYGRNHPYGRYSTAEAFENIQREQLLDFYQSHYVTGNCIILVSGKLPADLEQQLNQSLGHLPLQGNRPNITPIATAPLVEKKYRVNNDEQGIQGAIRIARPFPTRHHPDFLGMQVLNNVLGGYFSSRLMNNIREDKGYTYGIHSYIQSHLHHASLHISTEAGREVCEPAIAEIYKEMSLLCNEPVSAEELGLVRNYMMGGLLGDLDGPFQIMSRWKTYLLNNLPPDYFQQSLQTIRSITPAQLQQLAQQYLQPDSFYELVVV
jgi:predicted Zn-dependent peptidase